MVSFNVYRATSSGAYIEGVCLASDEKPIVGISNGSILYAVDASDGTTTRYMFDQSTASWIEAECPCSGGGGEGGGEGGGSTSSGLVIQKDAEGALDKTWQEIHDALASGIVPVILFPDNTDAAYGLEDSVAAVALAGHETGSETSGLYVINDGYGSLYACESANGYPLISEG